MIFFRFTYMSLYYLETDKICISVTIKRYINHLDNVNKVVSK